MEQSRKNPAVKSSGTARRWSGRSDTGACFGSGGSAFERGKPGAHLFLRFGDFSPGKF